MGWFQRARNSWSAEGGSFDEEARFHLDQRTAEFIREGMSADEARREARKRFGNVALANDRSSDANRVRWMDDFRRDLGYGFRMLRRNPGFSVLAVLCLTLGIGANAAVFSWIEGVMLRPYPAVQDEDSLYVIAGTAPEATKGTDISWPDFKDLERNATTIQAFIADRINGAVIGLVDQKGEHHIPVHGTVGFPYFGELILDCLNRTEKAMTQRHAFLAIELALVAQGEALRIG